MEFKVHKRMEFTSDRKRMSIIVTDPEDGLIKLYSKGADTIMLDRLAEDLDQKSDERLSKFLNDSSVKGLRTLVMCMKILDPEDLENFNKALDEADNDLANRDEIYDQIFDAIERDFTMIGATCVEDRL